VNFAETAEHGSAGSGSLLYAEYAPLSEADHAAQQRALAAPLDR
jgi:hypothetical protein